MDKTNFLITDMTFMPIVYIIVLCILLMHKTTAKLTANCDVVCGYHQKNAQNLMGVKTNRNVGYAVQIDTVVISGLCTAVVCVSSVCVCMGMCVMMCEQNIFKSCKQILMKFLERVGRGPRTSRLDFDGSAIKLYPLMPHFFTPIMDFQ